MSTTPKEPYTHGCTRSTFHQLNHYLVVTEPIGVEREAVDTLELIEGSELKRKEGTTYCSAWDSVAGCML